MKRRRKRRYKIRLSRLLLVLFVLMLIVVAALMLSGHLNIANLFFGGSNASSIDYTIPSGVMSEPSPEQLSDYFKNDWRLIYIGKDNPLPSNYKVTYATVNSFSVDARIADDLKAMLNAAKNAGYNITIAGAYRSPERSQELYDQKVKDLIAQGVSSEDAQTQAGLYVALPNYSEHNAGISVDLNFPEAASSSSDNVDYSKFASYQWMLKHCSEYGFILRYPSDKSDLTGVTYEPWHFRYVGKEHAQVIMENGYCLEEYLKELNLLS